jgi:hypothetical protein
LKKSYFSSHKLPKQQSTSFWSQGILGVKIFSLPYLQHSNIQQMFLAIFTPPCI